MNAPRLTIVDMRSGRGLGGHSRDYLRALQDALSERAPETIAPFLSGGGSRLSVYTRGFSAYRRAISGGGLAIVQNTSLNDYICLAGAALTLPRSSRGACLAMLYRDPSPRSFGAGAAWLSRVVIWLVTRLIRAGILIPMSDSKTVLAAWTARASGAEGHLVPTPPLPGADADAAESLELPDAEPLVVIPGAMRAEKGAANYAAVAEAVLAEFPDGGIAIQAVATDEASERIARQLEQDHHDDERVLVLTRHLDASEYRQLLEAAAIAVLPYDVDAYGAGSSGVVGDALASGAVVVAAPIDWIRTEYAGDPRVVFVEQPGDVEQLRSALSAAAGAEAAKQAGGGADFAERWNAAVEAALSR